MGSYLFYLPVGINCQAETAFRGGAADHPQRKLSLRNVLDRIAQFIRNALDPQISARSRSNLETHPIDRNEARRSGMKLKRSPSSVRAVSTPDHDDSYLCPAPTPVTLSAQPCCEYFTDRMARLLRPPGIAARQDSDASLRRLEFQPCDDQSRRDSNRIGAS